MTKNFDPRFDARFQPGYEPKRGHDATDSAEVTDDAKATVAPSATPIVSPPAIADPLTATAASAAEASEPEPGASANTGVRVDTDEGFEPEPHPFERTLWIVSIVLVVGGMATAYWASNLNSYMGNGGVWSLPQMLQSSAWALSGPMVTVGLAVAVGLLFRKAITWKPSE